MKPATWVLALGLVLSATNVQAGRRGHGKVPELKDLNPGQWQTTVRIQMPGSPIPLAPVIMSRCFTKTDFIPAAELTNPQFANMCKMADKTVTANSAKWQVQCKNPVAGGNMIGTGEIRFSGDTFTGNLTMSMQGLDPKMGMMNMRYDITGKRVGPCTGVAPTVKQLGTQ
jgi:hypothetical protein